MVIQAEQTSNLAGDAHRHAGRKVSSRPLRLAAEFVIVLLIVLLFFSIVLGIANMHFPIRTNLKELAYHRLSFQSISRELMVASGDQDSGLAAANPLTTQLTEISNKVNVKFAQDIAWSTAQIGMPLHHRDAVQTYERARALIEFGQKSYLDIGENSLVVFQRMEPDLFVPKLRTFRVMVEGELRGRLSQSEGGLINLQVALPGAKLHMPSAEGAGDEAEFRVVINPDQSATVAIYEGDAEVLIAGKSIRLAKNRGVTIRADGQLLGPVPLPSQPVPKLPLNGNVTYYRELPPKIAFSWEPSQPVEGYRFVLARDRDFLDIIVNERLTRPTFTHGNLKNGRYYWRVRALVGQMEGGPGELRQLHMVQDRTPPVLRLQLPPKVVRQDQFTIHGSTEPGARVFVQGNPVPISKDGRIEHNMRIKAGASVIVIEAVDPAGNVAYATKLVNGTF